MPALINLVIWLSWGMCGTAIPDTAIVLQPVEVVGTRYVETPTAGGRVTKIDTLVMKSKLSASLSDLLSENSQVFVKNNGRGALSTVSFRGTAASHTNVYWNGIDINAPTTGMVDFSLIPVFVIDNIKLKHGPASIADNSGGIGGSIHIGNSDEIDTALHVGYTQNVGSFKTFSEFLRVSFAKKRFAFRTRVYDNYSKNDYTFVNRNIKNYNGTTGKFEHPVDTNDNGGYHVFGLMQEVNLTRGKNNLFSFKYWGQHANRSIPRVTSYEGDDDNNVAKQTDTDHRLLFEWKRYGNNNELVIKSAYAHNKLHYTLKNNIHGVGLVDAVNSFSDVDNFINMMDFNKNFKNDFVLKCSANTAFRKVNSVEMVKNTGYDVNRFETSAFVSLEKTFFDKLRLNAMLRQNLIDRKFSPTILFFGFDYKILQHQELFVKANVAKNHHTPTLNDLYWQPGGNPELKTENSVNYDIGISYKSNTKQMFSFECDVTFYYADVKNWILWIPSYKGFWQPENIENVISQGVEIWTSHKLHVKDFDISLSCNYLFSSAKNHGDKSVWGEASYGKQLVYVPLHSANAFFTAEYKKNFLTYQFNFYSRRYTTTSNDVTKRDELYPYFMHNLSMGRNFSLGNFDLAVEIKVYNILNESYYSVLYRPMPGINYLLQCSINL